MTNTDDLFKLKQSEPPKTFESFMALNMDYYVGLADIDFKKSKVGDKTLQDLLGDVPKTALKDKNTFFEQYKSHYETIAKDDYARLLELNARSIARGF